MVTVNDVHYGKSIKVHSEFPLRRRCAATFLLIVNRILRQQQSWLNYSRVRYRVLCINMRMPENYAEWLRVFHCPEEEFNNKIWREL